MMNSILNTIGGCVMKEKESKKRSDLSINIAFTSFGDDAVMVNIVGAKTEDEARKMYDDFTVGEEKVVHYCSFAAEDIISDDGEIDAGFRIVEALMHHPTTVVVMEQLLAKIFEASQKMALQKNKE